jgi:hypothetical protein
MLLTFGVPETVVCAFPDTDGNWQVVRDLMS